MIEKEVTVRNRAGVHTRPAASIVKAAARFKSEIFLIRDGFSINAKSIIGVMTLAAEQGAILTLQINGPDEESAFTEIENLFNSGFDEL
jgi:phosphocarrier protein HPr